MYFVKYGNEYLHNPRMDEYMLFDLSLDCEENSCGFCDFTIYPNHPLYNKLKECDAVNQIKVYDDDELLFAGFIYELGKEFQLEGHVKCKGELAYLAESITRTYSTCYREGYGSYVPQSVNGYFNWLINNHNSQVDDARKFKIGVVQGEKFDIYDKYGNGLIISNKTYSNTWEEINKNLIGEDGIGGYLIVRHENEDRYIDYIYDYSDVNTQVLDFGINLTNYTQTDDCSEIATFIIPTGAKMEETDYVECVSTPEITFKYGPYYGYFQTRDTEVNPDKLYYNRIYEEEIIDDEDDDVVITVHNWLRYVPCYNLEKFEIGVTYYEIDPNVAGPDLPLTIAAMPDGVYGDFVKKGDMLYSESAVKKYGWIGYTFSNPDLKRREQLLKEASDILKKKIEPKRTIEIKAVDMHLINPDIKPIRIGEYVRVRSKPHNLDSYFICRSIDLDLNKPDNSKYVLGISLDTYTSAQKKAVTIMNNSVTNQFGEVSKKVSKIAAKKTGDQVSEVSITFADGSTETYSYAFNSDGDITKFGDIPINWD